MCVYHGTQRELNSDADVLITTYSIMRLDENVLSKIVWDVAVLDEAQAIKNPESQVARAAYNIQAKFKVTLTGTPIENRLDDVWSQFNYLNPGLLGARKHFNKNYSRPISAGDEKASTVLHTKLKPFILRRLKSEVATELPKRTTVVLYNELSEEEKHLYKSIHAATKAEVLEKLNLGGGVMQALELLLRLRQTVCHPALIPGQTAKTSAKVELLLSNLEESLAAGHKVLIFSQWTKFLNLIEPHIKERNFSFLRIDGSTRDRGTIVDKFNEDSSIQVMLLSLKAAGVGLNLTAADHVVILDPWWNPAIEEQAADRAHRIGQTKPVIVQKLVAKDTVEEKILALQEKRSN